MMTHRDDPQLDDAIREALGSEPIAFDAARWVARYPQEVALLESWAIARPAVHRTGRVGRFLRRHAMKLSLAAAAAVVIAVLSSLPSQDKGTPGVAWADMAQQLRSARTVRVHRTVNPPTTEQAASEDTFLWKAPDKSRTDAAKPRVLTTICNADTQLILDPGQKTYAQQSNISARASIDWLFALAAVPPPNATGLPTASIEGQDVELVPETTQLRDGRELRKYRMKLPANHGAPGEIKYAWFDTQTYKLAMFTSEMQVAGTPYEAARVEVELDVELPDELFSTTPPAGYREASAESLTAVGCRPAGSPGSRPAVFEEYIAARTKIDNYRLVAWSKRDTSVLPAGRSFRKGKVYRADWFKPRQDNAVASASAVFDRAQPWADPAAAEWVWSLSDRNVIMATTLPYRGQPASIQTYMRVMNEDRGPAAFGSDPNADRYLISHLGWPLHFEGQEILIEGKPLIVYAKLPARADRAGLVGVRAAPNPARSGQGPHTLNVYWLDPAKDFLCAVHEQYQRADQPWHDDLNWQPAEPVNEKPPEQRPSPTTFELDTITRIAEFGRTAAGRWYPLALSREHYRIVAGKRYGPTAEELRVQIEFDRPIPAQLLEWPKGVPEPKPWAPPAQRPAKR